MVDDVIDESGQHGDCGRCWRPQRPGCRLRRTHRQTRDKHVASREQASPAGRRPRPRTPRPSAHASVRRTSLRRAGTVGGLRAPLRNAAPGPRRASPLRQRAPVAPWFGRSPPRASRPMLASRGENEYAKGGQLVPLRVLWRRSDQWTRCERPAANGRQPPREMLTSSRIDSQAGPHLLECGCQRFVAGTERQQGWIGTMPSVRPDRTRYLTARVRGVGGFAPDKGPVRNVRRMQHDHWFRRPTFKVPSFRLWRALPVVGIRAGVMLNATLRRVALGVLQDRDPPIVIENLRRVAA